MAYVAIRGGEQAMQAAEQSLDYLRALSADQQLPLQLDVIEQQLRLLTSRVISEGGYYHPALAALAIKQSHGDTLEAALSLRSYRSTQSRLATTPVVATDRMRLIRRISSAFKDVPGGQCLGPTFDYTLRLLRMDLASESADVFRTFSARFMKSRQSEHLPDSFPKVLDSLREEGLLPPLSIQGQDAFDITRDPLVPPVSRPAALATMCRAETGSLLAMAYSNMRGYGDIHPTIAELRVGYVPVLYPHAVTGELIEAGEVLITECEVIAMYDKPDANAPTFNLGYGVCFGHHEIKAICMAIVDRSLQKGMRDGPQHPSEDPEFVLMHIDGVDSMGFASHYKMPHYVTFQSDMDRLRVTRQKAGV